MVTSKVSTKIATIVIHPCGDVSGNSSASAAKTASRSQEMIARNDTVTLNFNVWSKEFEHVSACRHPEHTPGLVIERAT